MLENELNYYLVGGAVRDEILGIPVKDRDYVVVGATPAQLLNLGFQQVGNDFPVFLHPRTHEEFALARTEKKIGRGYQGFRVDFNPNVTLAEDLQRRDLTINAIARDKEGHIIDPYHGVNDLQSKLLRHVSPAFIEDPVRLLRVARFYARFYDEGFCIAEETLQLLKTMVKNGEINALQPERVLAELTKALMTSAPAQFFTVLQQCGALVILFPIIANFWQDTKQQQSCHSHLKIAAQRHFSPACSFAVIAAYFSAKQDDLKQFNRLYPLPKSWQRLAKMVIDYSSYYSKITQLNAVQVYECLMGMDVLRGADRFQEFLQISAILANTDAFIAPWQRAYEILKSVDINELLQLNLSGKALGEAIQHHRILALTQYFPQDKS
ncbi:MAG: multifunctional CCA tRNA nucleotidyl transferase/2'3'-cyclic phosphodiesterase/2'nucleotidase/phosphatase [Legionellales bacterium]|nr:multifunctional CCA tRNA nucleotidyl transferase/2'3'-cyclic phosphodiesterase/2'nucleotidase/phosphatase [Legionellales bacterium]